MIIHNNSLDESNYSFQIYNNPYKKHLLNYSSSSDNIFLYSKRTPSKNKSLYNFPFIYSNIKVNKAPTLNQIKKEILMLSSQAKKKRTHMVNSLHKTTLRQALLNDEHLNELLITSSNDFYKTKPKIERPRSILNNSSMQDTSIGINNSIEYVNKLNISAYESMAQEIKKEKMSLQIGSLFALSASKPTTLIKRCTNFSIIEDFCNSRKQHLTMLKGDLQSKIENLANIQYRLLHYKKLFEEGYFKVFNTYIIFLNKQIEKEILKKKHLLDKKKQIENEVSKLKMEVNRLNKTVSKEKEIRNFLISVKEKRNYNPLLIECISQGKDIHINNITNEQIERYKEYLNPKKQIFNSVNDFINCFNELENKGFNLLMESEKVTLSLELMKESLFELHSEGQKHEEIINKQIIYKQKVLDIRKAIYTQLIKQRNGLVNYTNSISPSQKEKLNEDMQHRSKTKVSSTFNKEFLAVLKYNDLIKKHPIAFSILYSQLLQQVKVILDLKVLTEEHLLSVGLIKTKVELHKLFNVQLNQKNETAIRTSCLKLINIYERAVILIYEQHKMYKKNPTLKDEIVYLMFQKQNLIKIKHAEAQRKLLEEQRKYEINKIIQKTNKAVFTTRKRVPEKMKFVSSLSVINQNKTEHKTEELKFTDFVSSENIE